MSHYHDLGVSRGFPCLYPTWLTFFGLSSGLSSHHHPLIASRLTLATLHCLTNSLLIIDPSPQLPPYNLISFTDYDGSSFITLFHFFLVTFHLINCPFSGILYLHNFSYLRPSTPSRLHVDVHVNYPHYYILHIQAFYTTDCILRTHLVLR